MNLVQRYIISFKQQKKYKKILNILIIFKASDNIGCLIFINIKIRVTFSSNPDVQTLMFNILWRNNSSKNLSQVVHVELLTPLSMKLFEQKADIVLLKHFRV